MMRTATAVLFGLTVTAGYAAFANGNMPSESLKLLYAFLALTTVVCGMICMAETHSLQSRASKSLRGSVTQAQSTAASNAQVLSTAL